MRERAISSIGVVVIGLVPALIGGPVFAIVLAALMLIGYDEFGKLTAQLGARTSPLGYLMVALFALVAFWADEPVALAAAVTIAVGLPLIATVLGPTRPAPEMALAWAYTAAGVLYLGLPLFAAVAIRTGERGDHAGWLGDLSDVLSPGWAGAASGLGWLLIVIVATWLGDTFAYLVGRSVGRRPLLPSVSPKKTVEGSLGGLAGSLVAGALGVALFGLGVSPWIGAAFGLALGVVGQLGDLAESMLKRQAGVKDSGSLIRGHGGVLDRIDALIFALSTGYLLIPLAERWGS